MTLLGAALAVIVGLTLGMLGAGGSILTVPIFLYVLGIAVKPAIAMSLPVVGVSAFAGFLLHRRKGRINGRLALTFGAIAAISAFTTARLFAPHVPDRAQLLLFALATISASVLMWRSSSRGGAESPSGLAAARAIATPGATAVLAAQALAIGALTALIGVGGGFLIVPALVLITKLPMTEAIGTSLLVISINALSGFLGYLGSVPIDWATAGAFTLLMIVGLGVGTRLAGRVSPGTLRKMFAVLVLAIGVYVLVRSGSSSPA